MNNPGYDTLSETEWELVQRVWDLLDDGEVEPARAEVSRLSAERPGHPDVRIVAAAVALEDQEPEEAVRLLEGAERSADPALFFHLRAAAAYELTRIEDARDDAMRALSILPDAAEVHDLLARALDHLGDSEGADAHAEKAAAIAPERFPLPLEVSDDAFDEIVERCVRELPDKVRDHLDELPVLVEALPSRELLQAGRPVLSPDLLGLYVGRHLMERSTADVPGLPSAIYLFRHNLLRMCRDRDELVREIRTTVQHEVGHLIGLDEDDLEQWGLA